MSSGGLANAAEDRKARLAALKSLKRKQPDSDQADNASTDDLPPPKSPKREESSTPTTSYLSGRNYDPETRGPKFGFESNPAENLDTLEKKAAALAEETRLQAEKEAAQDKPLDLFNLQPKKPNWDLKRDLDRKLHVINVRTDNAIAKLVRERIAANQAAKKAPSVKDRNGEHQDVGMDGAIFVEATREREREDEDEEKRERQMDEQLLDGT